MLVSDLEEPILSFHITPLRIGRCDHKWFARTGLLEGLGETLEEAVLALLGKVKNGTR